MSPVQRDPRIRALVFDLDGTLIDSLEDIARCLNEILPRYQLPTRAVRSYRELVGEGVRTLIERAAPDADTAVHDEIVRAFREHYAAHLLDTTRLYDGVAEMLDRVVGHGLPIAVLSNKPQAMTEHVARALLARWPLAAVLGDRDGVPRKPAPAGALQAAAALTTPPEACALVGDTRTDMATATAAGMIAVGVLWGFRDAAELRRTGAEHLLEHPTELAALVGAAP